MFTILEFGLAVLVLSLIALGIAVLGDHVASILRNADPWPARPNPARGSRNVHKQRASR